jgi:hypothetical protein
MGSATFLAVIVAGFLSAVWVDRHYAAGSAMPSASACVGDDALNNWIRTCRYFAECPKR